MDSKPEPMAKKKMPAKKMPMKKKAAPADPSHLSVAATATGTGPRRASPRRMGSSSPRRMGGPPGTPPRAKAADNEYNKQFIEQLKAPSAELRATGSDIETEPTLEIGLLLDCTSSMGSWIAKAKETINEIIDKVVEECKEDGQLKCRVSFVGYRDIKDNRRFEVMAFNENIDEVRSFIKDVRAEGGADMPEDMQGGLKLCLLQDWTEEATKRVVIITDAPPHGKQYHGMGHGDHYPEGSPEGIVIEDLMKEFCKKEIDFQVIKLNNSVDKMIEVMKASHQEVEVTDMSGASHGAIAMDDEYAAESMAMGGGGGGGAPDTEMYMKRKFVGETVKSLASKVKSKKMMKK